ncbi:hypothetical protein [Pedobacter sp. MW01-1-1]|uniref:hypothetical protein n=1 Tax=Pedobacter sp. MW01-1-1 TaxID=3383027 RepID=UPI003FF09C92
MSLAQNIAAINGKTLTSKEFIWAYKKGHNGNLTTDYDSLQNYLNLYINFKLKVLEARELGLDKNTAYEEEIKTYENALKTRKKPNYSEKEYTFLLNEYREGVLMFNLSEQKIWDKINNNDWAIVDYYEKNIAHYNKPLNEVKADVMADYQQYLEENWLKSLKEKYPVKINQNELKRLAKQ